MNTDTYHNSPIKNCMNCAHRIPCSHSDNFQFDHCARFGGYCEINIHYRTCDFSQWRQKPPEPEPEPPKPRRSLRQWLYDTFWRKA